MFPNEILFRDIDPEGLIILDTFNREDISPPPCMPDMTVNVVSVKPSHTPAVTGYIDNDPHSYTYFTGNVVNSNPSMANTKNLGDAEMNEGIINDPHSHASLDGGVVNTNPSQSKIKTLGTLMRLGTL